MIAKRGEAAMAPLLAGADIMVRSADRRRPLYAKGLRK
jgi:hypothetical protein